MKIKLILTAAVSTLAACGGSDSPDKPLPGTPANRAPIASNALFKITEDQAYTADLTALVSDADGDALTITANEPQNGTLAEISSGKFVYRPAANFHGEDRFTFEVSDGKGGQASGSIVFEIAPSVHLVWTQGFDVDGAADLFAAGLEENSSDTRLAGAELPAKISEVLPAPGGKGFIYLLENGGIYWLEPDSEEKTLEIAASSTGARNAIALAGNAPKLAYASAEETLGGFNWEITLFDLDTREERAVLSGVKTSGLDKFEYQLSRNGRWLVYLADSEQAGRWALYVLDLQASQAEAKRLSHAMTTGTVATRQHSRNGFRITPDSFHVVYAAADDSGDFHLYSASVEEPGTATLLTPASTVASVIDAYTIDANSLMVAYVKAQEEAERSELYVVDMTVPGVATKLNPELVAGGRIEGIPFFTAGGGNVVYYADQETDDVRDLYVASVLSPGVSAKLVSGRIEEILSDEGGSHYRPDISISADGTRIGFRKTDAFSLQREALLVDVQTGLVRKISDETDEMLGHVFQLVLNPSGHTAAYSVGTLPLGVREVFVVDLVSEVAQPERISVPENGTVKKLHGFID